MRILFFINHLAGGGAERVAATLLNHLCERHEISIVFFSDKKASYEISPEIATQKIIIEGKHRIVKALKRINRINKLIKSYNPDLIISFLTYTNIYVLLANMFLRKKIIVSEHNTLNRIKQKSISILRRLLYPTADEITFVTKSDQQNFGLPQKSITIYNPALFESFNNIDDRQKSIITIAAYNRWYNKGLDLLLKAWAQIAPQNPNWNLEIYGDKQDEQLQNSFLSNKAERTTMNDWCDNIDKVLQTKSIFVLASRFEGCPCSLIEAMSQGCACVVTDCDGGQKEIIEDGVDGLIAKNENVNDIAEKLQMLINDEILRRRLAARAIEKVKMFDKNAFFKQWDNLIDKVTII
ncbi:MAG: glycosyltransferase [Salinivirgaceae bacterium]|nr:glycosyltransferase [Salinivirgaceae bacterium]